MCLYGRRRCGKSRLLLKALEKTRYVYYVADERDSILQRRAMAKEIARLVPGFDRVEYPGWDELFEKWYEQASAGSILAIDELPYLVAAAPEIPSILQRRLDAAVKGCHLALCGSSQRMMSGMILNSSSPLYGRAHEILNIKPLNYRYLSRALQMDTPVGLVDAYALWGGVPRYWELARDCDSLWEAVTKLVLSPLGVLHGEPKRLLLDELQDTRLAASMLAIIGQGCHRISEIAGRLQRPATSLSRPLSLLVEMGYVKREIPFGVSIRDTKRSLYTIDDPFLRFCFRFVEPNRSRLEDGRIKAAQSDIMSQWPQYRGEIWEDMVRQSISSAVIAGKRWRAAARWWGKGPVEFDVVAQDESDKNHLLIGEAKTKCGPEDVDRLATDLSFRIANSPFAQGYKITRALFILESPKKHVSDAITLISGTELFSSMPKQVR